jgi:outer membrane protein
MQKYKSLLIALLLVGLVPSAAGALQPAETEQSGGAAVYDMKAAVNRALEANPQMRAIRRAYRGAEFGVKSARGDFGPELSTNYAYRHVEKDPASRFSTVVDDTWTWTVTVSQDLFTGWRNLSAYEKSVLQKESTGARIDQTELALIQSVQENFLGLLKAREDVRSAEDQVKRLTEQLKVTQAFYDVGLKPRLDVLQAEARLAQAENDLVVAKNQVKTRIARLNTLLSLSHDAEVKYVGELEYMPFSMSVEQCLDLAYEQRPDLEIAKKSVVIASKDKKITQSEFWPQVGAEFEWQTWGDDPAASGAFEQRTSFSQWSAGLSATWKIFESGKVYYASKQARERVDQLKAEADNTRQEATFEVKSNRLDIDEAAERILVARKALTAARESYRMALARYQAQVGTNIDVLDAQAQVTQSEADLTQALADYRIAVARVFVSMGEKNPGLLAY